MRNTFSRHQYLNLLEVPRHPPNPPLHTKLLVVERGFSQIDPLLWRSSRLELRASSHSNQTALVSTVCHEIHLRNVALRNS